MADAIFYILAAWAAVSIPVSLMIGSVIRSGGGPDSNSMTLDGATGGG